MTDESARPTPRSAVATFHCGEFLKWYFDTRDDDEPQHFLHDKIGEWLDEHAHELPSYVVYMQMLLLVVVRVTADREANGQGSAYARLVLPDVENAANLYLFPSVYPDEFHAQQHFSRTSIELLHA